MRTESRSSRTINRWIGALLTLGLACGAASANVAGLTLPETRLADFAQPTTITLDEQPTVSAAYARVWVQPGDTIGYIADRYGVSAHDVRVASDIVRDSLYVGQALKVPIRNDASREARLPPGVRVHTVRAGEVLSGILFDYGVSQIDLISANPGIPSLDHMAEGTRLLLPGSHKGLVVELKPGQSVLDVSRYYSVPVTDIFAANEVRDPSVLVTGDFVLVPGIAAKNTLADLERHRASEIASLEKARQDAENQRLADLAAAQAQEAAQAAAAESAQKREQLRVAQRLNVQRVVRVAASYRPPVLQGGGYSWPLRSFQVTSGFGERGFWIGSSNFHTGIDLAAPTGAPIYAAASGTVIEAGWGDFGQDVKIAVGEGVVNIYGHMSGVATGPGASVGRGQLIGYVGCTGICTGPHLHFEVDVDGAPRNPYGYLP